MVGGIEAETAIPWVLTLLGMLSIGSQIGLYVNWRIDKSNGQRIERRDLYLELLTMMRRDHRVMTELSLDQDAPRPTPYPEEHLDAFNARLNIDSSREINDLARECFNLRLMFFNSLGLRAPISRDEFGLFHYDFQRMRQLDDEGKALIMRIELGSLSDKFRTAMDAIDAQVRKELHGD